MRNAGIVRNTAKIQATISNARATLKVWDAGLTLSEVIWKHYAGTTQEYAMPVL